MRKFDLVLQGPMYDYSGDVIKHYGQFDFIENIIVSTWEADSIYGFTKYDPKAKYLFNKDVPYPGIGNINRQLKSSLEGVKRASNDYVIKMRTDQLWYPESMYAMYEFFEEYKDTDLKRLDDDKKPYNKIFIEGHLQAWNFASNDHMFWGHKSDLIDLFDIPPYMAQYIGKWGDYTKHLRAECYISLNYYAKFDARVKHMLENMTEYCYDGAPKWTEANNVWYELSSRVLKPFKMKDLHFRWPKNNMEDYHWDYVHKEYLQWGHEHDPHYK